MGEELSQLFCTITTMKTTLFIFFYATFFLILACQDNSNKPVVAPVNPNGDSELALLMRAMFEDGEGMKKKIEAGELPLNVAQFTQIHTAQATQPEKVNTDAYRKMTADYLASVDALKAADVHNAKDIYNSVISKCMSCHQAVCPGPMVRIKKLYVELD